MNNFFWKVREIMKDFLKFEIGQECFFRGHGDIGFKLLPGIYRKGNYSITSEESLFYEFRSKATSINNNILSDWDLLFYMQHHGCNTRLLDWTDSLGTALFFALSEYNKGEKPAIFLLNPYALNKKYRGWNDLYDPENLNHKDGNSYSQMVHTMATAYKKQSESITVSGGIWWEKPIAIYPIRKAERLSSQNGYFTIQGTDKRPLEDQILEAENIWSKIEIPVEIIPELKQHLELFGINEYSIFPDLDGLSRYLNNKFKLSN